MTGVQLRGAQLEGARQAVKVADADPGATANLQAKAQQHQSQGEKQGHKSPRMK